MSYGLKYNYDFDNKVASYTLEISEKDYSGDTTNIKGASSSVVHSWDTDEPKPPIKGSSLVVNLINEGGLLPLSDFYSTDDEKFKAKLIWHSSIDITLFEGFVVLQDSRELMVDFNHEINISATDNLGLLKDIPFNQAPFQIYTTLDSYTANVTGFPPHQIVRTTPGGIIQAGDQLVISGGTGLDGTYTVDNVLGTTGSASIYVKEAVPSVATVSATITINTPDFYTLRSLLSITHSCISATGLELNTRIFANINEVSQDDTECFFDQTLLDPQTFFNGSTWDDCYEVLTKILQRFNCTLFQSKGMWNIVRWDELRDFDYAVPGFVYDSDFVLTGTQNLDDSTLLFGGYQKFAIGIGEVCQAETGLEQAIVGAFKYTKETFNYKQPDEILRNANLQQLGNLLDEYTVGSNTVKEYEMPWWTIIAGSYTGTPLYFIRVIYDNLGNEIDRLAVLGNGSIESFPIQAAEGDRFTFSFTVLTTNSQPGNVNIIFDIKDDDGTTTKYLREDGTWNVTRGYTVNIASGDNTNVSHSFDISGVIPYDGLLTVSLADFDQSGGADETHYRDIRLEYTPMINQSTKIIGQVHKSTQAQTIKKNDEREILIDTSPRNSIAGTLFLDSVTGVLQDRAGQWKRKPRTESKNLGEITTSENLFLHRTARTQLEGTFYGLVSSDDNHLSLITVIRYTYFPDLNFIFGKLEIDYSQNTATGTLYEMYKDTETDSDLNYVYTFTFLYDTK